MRRELAELKIAVGQLTEQLSALDRLTDSKFITHRTLLDSQAEKVALALASADKAVSKAESATERRFEAVNEFRQTLSDQAALFATRKEVEQLVGSNAEKIASLTDRINKTEGRSTGFSSGWAILVGAVLVVGSIVGMLVALGR